MDRLAFLRKLLLAMLLLASQTRTLESALPHDDFIITPIPKAGTHLLMKCVKLMTGKNTKPLCGRTPESSLDQAKQENRILKWHHYNRNVAKVVQERHYKVIFLCRDPRDACVSLIFYLDRFNGVKRDVFTVPENWDQLSFDDKLHAVIVGKDCPSYMETWYKRLILWSKHEETLVVKFEELIGKNGGGSDEMQQRTLTKMAKHIHLDLNPSQIQQIAKALYMPTSKPETYKGITYIPGQMGNWKRFFNAEHKKVFKKLYNPILLRLGYEKNRNW